jgi:hypothetical protein
MGATVPETIATGEKIPHRLADFHDSANPFFSKMPQGFSGPRQFVN